MCIRDNDNIRDVMTSENIGVYRLDVSIQLYNFCIGVYRENQQVEEEFMTMYFGRGEIISVFNHGYRWLRSGRIKDYCSSV